MDVAAMDASGHLVGVRQFFLDDQRHLRIARHAAPPVT